MLFIGNYKKIVTDELINHLETHEGDLINVWQPHRWKGHPILDEARERARFGYSNGKSVFHQFNSSSVDMQNFTFELPPLPSDDNRKFHWWIVKLLPGEMQAMHIDPHLVEIKNPQRYTLYLQDWIPGHIFTYDDKMIANYKSGDLYRWSDPMCYHGCVNIGFETRYTIQLTTFDE